MLFAKSCGKAGVFVLVQVMMLGCAPSPKPCLPVAVPLPAPPSAPPAAAPARERLALAVLPIDDDELFRTERSHLRTRLAASVLQQAPGYHVLPFSEVDDELGPWSKAGKRCAYEHASWERKAKRRNWRFTHLMHVTGGRDGVNELWVELRGRPGPEVVLSAPWNTKQPLAQRYGSAFAAMRVKEGMAGLVGGLVSGSRPGALQLGELTLCVAHGFTCAKETAGYGDVASRMATCFDGIDALSTSLVLDEGACEMSLLDDVKGPAGQRERCLCAAVRQSRGFSATGRRSLALSYVAADLIDKARPQIRVLELSNNLGAEIDYTTHKSNKRGKVTRTTVRRLVAENIDALAAPASRCTAPPNSVVVVELDITEAGRVVGATVLDRHIQGRLKTCLETALMRGAFDCTSNGKPGRTRLALIWPE